MRLAIGYQLSAIGLETSGRTGQELIADSR
jgi:hypothetical protein